VIAVPEGVTVPAGATSVAFRATVSSVANPTQVRITTFDDFFGATRPATTVTVLPVALTGLAVEPEAAAGGHEGGGGRRRRVVGEVLCPIRERENGPRGEAGRGTVTLSGPAPAGGAMVSLSVSDTSAVTIPATVVVPAGATSASFPIRTAGIQAGSPVLISATWDDETRTAALPPGGGQVSHP
jgi:hypothetical protein